ncbi:MAG: gluconate 2-dehydrogenase subunit 3 family protein [Verrucomicrobia bacterium]|nr:gluconate 2-dehydrogenase subunit 3 family protein [Verrucomicrobiota bacterium]MDA1065811.1 gluconate 2-dehydrogenase subunit 3 family protein [Verrucomicrobiota bacterium]
MKANFSHNRMDRRSALKWMLAASATVHFLNTKSFGQETDPLLKGFGTDPDLLKGEVPWDRTMTADQLRTTSTLSDIILPHTSEESPSATEVHVPDFIDEWISAPYDEQQEDAKIIIEGLAWLDRESQRRFSQDFYQLNETQQTSICDDICFQEEALPEYQVGARFFTKFRNLTLGGYYTTNVGMKDVGYVGNVALAAFDGPPPEVLKQLGIDKAPW